MFLTQQKTKEGIVILMFKQVLRHLSENLWPSALTLVFVFQIHALFCQPI